MPASITHTYFALDLLDTFSEQRKRFLKPVLFQYKMFAQGTDPFMFYHILSPKPGKNVRRLQKFLHKADTQDFFITLIRIIKENNYQKNPEIMAFLYGQISHYILDSTIHPYVIYHTGFFNKYDKRTYKYNNIHAFMESFLDMDMVKRRTHQNPYTFRFDDFIFRKKTFSKQLTYLINSTYQEVYHLNNIGRIYEQSLKDMALFLRLFRYDPWGVKKFGYRLIDTFTTQRCFRFEALSYHVSLKDRYQFLNSKHQEWCYPSDDSIKSTESFIDLYLKAFAQAKKIIQQVDSYLAGEEIVLTDIFDNTSYISGLDCKLGLNFQYFKY